MLDSIKKSNLLSLLEAAHFALDFALNLPQYCVAACRRGALSFRPLLSAPVCFSRGSKCVSAAIARSAPSAPIADVSAWGAERRLPGYVPASQLMALQRRLEEALHQIDVLRYEAQCRAEDDRSISAEARVAIISQALGVSPFTAAIVELIYAREIISGADLLAGLESRGSNSARPNQLITVYICRARLAFARAIADGSRRHIEAFGASRYALSPQARAWLDARLSD